MKPTEFAKLMNKQLNRNGNKSIAAIRCSGGRNERNNLILTFCRLGPQPRPMYIPRHPFGLHLLLLTIIPCWAQGLASSDQDGWFARVARAQATQPHWITPVVVTPRLEEEFRYDISEQTH